MRPGKVDLLFEKVIPAYAYAAFEISRGDYFDVVDEEGKQVGDMVCFNRHEYEEKLSCAYSNVMNKKWLLTEGDSLYTNSARKMLTIVEDTVKVHYSGGGFCSDEYNYAVFGARGTRNCFDNLKLSLEPYGITPGQLSHDSCFNIFMNVVYESDGSLILREPLSRSGDCISFRAEMDCLVGISCCPQHRSPCNAFNPTSLRIKVYRS